MINKMRTFFSLIMVAGAATMFISVDAYAAQDNPHEEEQDGCDHGKTGKDCREDPSDKGKDCEEHGKHGGVNEDHCVTTSTVPGTTVITIPEITVTTVPGATDTTIPESTVITDPESPRTTTSSEEESLAVTGIPSEILLGFGTGMILFGAGLKNLIRRSY